MGNAWDGPLNMKSKEHLEFNPRKNKEYKMIEFELAIKNPSECYLLLINSKGFLLYGFLYFYSYSF